MTGRVYNADNMAPYELPANMTQSGIKSRSSKGGSPDNFNELRFEDKKGQEEIYFHAEKDYNRVVENNETALVGVDREVTVKNDENLTIENDQNIEVMNNQTVKIGVDQLGSHPLFALTIGVEITQGGDALEQLVEPLLAKARSAG